MNSDKVKNLLLYFVENIPNLPITKAMKLFFYSDFVSFAETGKSITELDYHCWDQGPVPPVVHRKLDKDKFDYVKLEKSGRSHLVKATSDARCVLSVFSPVELDVMKRVLNFGRDLWTTELSARTHCEFPWAKTERYEKISYEWAAFQKAVMEHKITPADEEIIMEVITRNPALHHFYESGLADWLDSSPHNEAEDLIDEEALTPVHWQKGIGWVQGH